MLMQFDRAPWSSSGHPAPLPAHEPGMNEAARLAGERDVLGVEPRGRRRNRRVRAPAKHPGAHNANVRVAVGARRRNVGPEHIPYTYRNRASSVRRRAGDGNAQSAGSVTFFSYGRSWKDSCAGPAAPAVACGAFSFQALGGWQNGYCQSWRRKDLGVRIPRSPLGLRPRISGPVSLGTDLGTKAGSSDGISRTGGDRASRSQLFEFSIELFERNYRELRLFLAHVTDPAVSYDMGGIEAPLASSARR